jgi:hypothetical protein
MKIWRHMGIGDVKTHTDRPRCFWGIGSRLGHPSKCQNRPRARRNHNAASLTMLIRCFTLQCMIMWAKFRLPSTESLKNKTRVVGGGERDGSGMGGGGVLMECFLHTRDPHSPSCGHFHTHFQKIQISRNAGMRDKCDGGWANSGGDGGGRTKQVDQCAHEYRKTGTHTHRAPEWTRGPRILNSSK